MKIVVTGALGHIGSSLIRNEHLYDMYDEVVLVDNLRTQRFPSLFDLPNGKNLTFINGSVEDLDLHSLMDKADAIVHLAAITDAAMSFGRYEEFRSVNLLGTQRIATAARETGTFLVFPSSTSVYGAQDSEVDETCGSLNPQSPYATVKIEEEETIRLAGEDGLSGTILRLGTIFGVSPGMRFHTAVNRFCWDAALGSSVQVWRESLDEVRPYLDLGDACRAIVSAAGRAPRGIENFNVLTLNATVRDVLDSIEQCGVPVEVELVDSPILNQTSYRVSTQRWLAEGFVYSGSLHEAVQETLNLFASIRQ